MESPLFSIPLKVLFLLFRPYGLSRLHTFLLLAVGNLTNFILNDDWFVFLDYEASLADEYSVLQLFIPLVASLV